MQIQPDDLLAGHRRAERISARMAPLAVGEGDAVVRSSTGSPSVFDHVV